MRVFCILPDFLIVLYWDISRLSSVSIGPAIMIRTNSILILKLEFKYFKFGTPVLLVLLFGTWYYHSPFACAFIDQAALAISC